jgi:membrane associated rhomboid family serine protease
MVLFLLTLSVWSVCFFFIRPTPADLNVVVPCRWKSFKEVQSVYWLGVFLMVVFLVSSQGSFLNIEETWYVLFAVNNVLFDVWSLVQSFTHIFFHFNFVHLIANLSFLGLLSVYKREVTTSRFLGIFLVSGIFSALSIFFMDGASFSIGASGGLFGLAAAYFLDVRGLTMKDYFIGSVMLVILFLIVSVTDVQTSESFSGNIDTLGHFFGLVSGVFICRLFPRKEY